MSHGLKLSQRLRRRTDWDPRQNAGLDPEGGVCEPRDVAREGGVYGICIVDLTGKNGRQCTELTIAEFG